MHYQLDEKEIDQIKQYLIEKLSPYLIVLFGTAAAGTMRSDSDIDIAYLSDNKRSDYEIFKTAQQLASLIGREVDLIDLSQASTVLQAQIVGKGMVLHCSDDYRRMLFEMVTLKKYARLNEEREYVLKNIKERGSIYGQ